jgi:hypothetical protein
MTSPHRSSGKRASQPAPSAESHSGWLDRLGVALGATSAIFAVVGVLLYLVLSLVCTAVYSPLGVTPAEVGLDYGNLLAQSAVAVAALTVIAMLTGLAVVALRIAMERPSVKRYRRLLTLLAGGVAIAFFLDLFLPLPVLDSPPFRVAGAVIVIAALAAAAYVLLVSAPARLRAQRQAAALAPAVGTVIVFAFALGLAGNALDGANDLGDGRRPSAFFVGIPAPWRAETARVTWTGAGSSSEIRFPDCLLYLGEASGTTVFYDARSDVQEALRVRSDDIAIAITHKRRSCPV